MNSNNPKLEPQLRAIGLSKRVGRVVCLRDASIELYCNETVAVVGSNGSGKTTLCDILSGFVVPDSGEIIVGESRARRNGPAWFGQRGVLRMFQAPRAFEQMTVLDTLSLSSYVSAPPSLLDSLLWRARRNQIREAKAVQRSEDILGRVEWQDLRNRQARALSYGQRKLLAALTLRLAAGSIAICDEPTAGLDAGRGQLVMQMLVEWKNEAPDRSLLIATHDLEYASVHAERTLRMERGALTGNTHV